MGAVPSMGSAMGACSWGASPYAHTCIKALYKAWCSRLFLCRAGPCHRASVPPLGLTSLLRARRFCAYGARGLDLRGFVCTYLFARLLSAACAAPDEGCGLGLEQVDMSFHLQLALSFFLRVVFQSLLHERRSARCM